MKYLIFAAICMGIFPLAVLMQLNRSWIRYGILLLIVPILCFDKVSINFFSMELYRGTARGMEVSLIYLSAITLLISLVLQRGYKTILPDLGCKYFALYTVLMLPSFLNADSTLIAFFELWKMWMMWQVFLAVYYYVNYYRELNTILYGFAIVVGCCFFAVVFQHVRGIHQANGIFPHQNSMGMFMNLIGAVFFSYYLNHSATWKRYLCGALFILAGACCARTYSRGALVCFPAGCLITVIVSLYYQFKPQKMQVLLPLLIIGVLGAMLMLPNVVKRFEEAPKESLETRQYLAASALNMIKDKPYCGVGLNNWGIKINPPYPYCEYRYKNPRIAPEFKEGIVETIYLLVGAECGVFCMTALLLWLGYYWVISWRLLPLFKSSDLFFLPAGTLGGLTAVYLQSTLEWVLKQQVNFIELMVLFGILSCLNHCRKSLARGEMVVKS